MHVLDSHKIYSLLQLFLAIPLLLACSTDQEASRAPGAELSEPEPELAPAPAKAAAAQPPRSDGKLFDAEQGGWLDDSDRDGTPDVVERKEGTDPLDDKDYPGAEYAISAFAGTCASSSFRLVPAGNGGVCIHTDEQAATSWTMASNICHTTHKTGRICTYEDLAFIYYYSAWDATYNSAEMWIGNLTGDDIALKGNVNISYNSSWLNFEKETSKVDSRQYWCCHTPD